MSDFHSFPLSSVFYNSAVRQRQDRGDITDLARSMARSGLLHPIIVTREGELVAGERRLLAAKELGWSHITVQFKDELSELDRELIEFDENAHRLDLSWQERVLAVQRYHQLSQKIEPKWTQDDTADRMGLHPATTMRHLRVAKALTAGNPLIQAAPAFSVAYGILERQDARKADSEKELLNHAIATKSLLPGEAPAMEEEPPSNTPVAPILNTDFIAWAQSYTGPKFNLIHCDFPYGIEAGDHDQGAAKSFGGYEDSEDTYWNLISALKHYGPNFISEAAHLVFWFSMKHYVTTRAVLTEADWYVNPVPLIWHRSDNSGILPDPRRSPRQVYETAFLCSRGDRFLIKPRSNLIATPNTKLWHMSEKPLPALDHILSMLVDETTTLLDPTCGSANALIVARRLGAKQVLGIERDPEFYKNALANWEANNV